MNHNAGIDFNLLSFFFIGMSQEQTRPLYHPNFENMLMIKDLLEYSEDYISYDTSILDKALDLEKYGTMGMDALHIACAQKAKVNFFITCDDNLLKKFKRIDNGDIRCYNIIDFIAMEVFKK